MNTWEGVSLAFQQIRQEKMKSFFSLLGIILGVMFLIVVVTVVEGLDQYVRELEVADLENLRRCRGEHDAPRRVSVVSDRRDP